MITTIFVSGNVSSCTFYRYLVNDFMIITCFDEFGVPFIDIINLEWSSD